MESTGPRFYQEGITSKIFDNHACWLDNKLIKSVTCPLLQL